MKAYIQFDTAINPGSSGGALVDDAGRLVGLVSTIFTLLLVPLLLTLVLQMREGWELAIAMNSGRLERGLVSWGGGEPTM